MKSFFSLLISFSLITQSFAGTVVIDGNVNARSSKDFHSTSNIETLTKGTEGDVIAKEEMPSGNFALQIRVKKIGAAGSSLKEGDTVWVYYHKKPNVRLIELYDDQHARVSDPNQGTWAEVIQDHRIKTRLVRASAQKNQGICIGCENEKEKNPPSKDEENIKKQVEDIGKFQKEKLRNIPLLSASDEELATLINKITASDQDHSNDNPATHRRLAVYINKYAAEYHVPIQYILAVIGVESGFHLHEKNPASTAYGLMQLTKATELQQARELRIVKADAAAVPKAKHENVELNIRMGIHRLSECIKDFPNDPVSQFAAYKLGSGGAREALKGRAPHPFRTYVNNLFNEWKRNILIASTTGFDTVTPENS